MENGFRGSDNVCQPDRTLATAAGDVHGIAEHRSNVEHRSGSLGSDHVINLVTLPVEFDASQRAKAMLYNTGLTVSGRETTAVRKMLDAAAWTYVAAFLTSLAYFLWHLLPLLLGARREEH